MEITFNIKKAGNKQMCDSLVKIYHCKLAGKGKTHWQLTTDNVQVIPNDARIMVSKDFLKDTFPKSYRGQMWCCNINEPDTAVINYSNWIFNENKKDIDLRWFSNHPTWISGKQLKELNQKHEVKK